MINTAYLRVYLPADRAGSWPEHEIDAEPGSLSMDGQFIWSEPLDADAFVTEWSGARYVCPRYPRLRMIEGILAFSGVAPNLAMLTDDERAALTYELESRRGRNSRSHILASPWHVPLRWFSAFSPSERELIETPAGLSIRYRTDIGEAADRVRWAVAVLDAVGFADQIVDQVKDLEQWISHFPAASMLELDYGSVAEDAPPGELTFDESVTEVRASLEALERGDADAARDAYMQVAGRWARRQSVMFAN
jgi:hypothetical protein